MPHIVNIVSSTYVCFSTTNVDTDDLYPYHSITNSVTLFSDLMVFHIFFFGGGLQHLLWFEEKFKDLCGL